MKVVPVILCGGSGTRLWPLSRELYPKQFLSLAGEGTLLQQTARRLGDNVAPLIVCNEEHRFLVAEQLRQLEMNVAGILLEPVARNTAPALGLAAAHLQSGGDDAVMVVLPSDHVIAEKDWPDFNRTLQAAIELAEQDYLVTFGVEPTRPETGYGYIEAGDPVGQGYKVQTFAEKPDLSTAEGYISSGRFFWNSGMFVFKASTYLSELGAFQPEIRRSIDLSIAGTSIDQDFVRVDSNAFSDCPAESIDYAVMEHTKQAAMVPLGTSWSDVGSWDALWEVSDKDGSQNVLRGDVLAENVTGSLVQAEHRLVSVVGVSDLVVVETADAVLIASKADSQHVKKIVASLLDAERDERITHRKVYRPWGSYESVDDGSNFQVKRIEVKPGASLSLQMHNHRAEHWIVVSGTAEVTCDDNIFRLNENESTYIPVGSKHRLTNPTEEPLEIIEVQSGDYLGEDDIIRFEDDYGRTDSSSQSS